MFLELFLVFLRLLQHYSFRRIGKYSNSVHKKERGKFPTLEELNLFQLFVINNNHTIAVHHQVIVFLRFVNFDDSGIF